MNGQVIDEEEAHYEIEEKDVLWYEISNEGETHSSPTTKSFLSGMSDLEGNNKVLSVNNDIPIASRKEKKKTWYKYLDPQYLCTDYLFA